jgi:hypothetical protein
MSSYEVSAPYSSVDWASEIVLEAGADRETRPNAVRISRAAALAQSAVLRDIIEDQDGAKTTPTVIPVPNVTGRALVCVAQFIHHHAGTPLAPIERPLRRPLREQLSEWDRVFLFDEVLHGAADQPPAPDAPAVHELLMEVLVAAQILGAQDLSTVASAGFASLLQGKSSAQVASTLGIADPDFTDSEKQKIADENKWNIVE